MNKECCKWCEQCLNTNLDKNEGYCYLDCVDFIKNTEEEICDSYRFDENLERC